MGVMVAFLSKKEKGEQEHPPHQAKHIGARCQAKNLITGKDHLPKALPKKISLSTHF